MFKFFRRNRPLMADKWLVIDGRVQTGYFGAYVGVVEAKTWRDARREANRLRPGISVYLCRYRQDEMLDATAGFD